MLKVHPGGLRVIAIASAAAKLRALQDPVENFLPCSL